MRHLDYRSQSLIRATQDLDSGDGYRDVRLEIRDGTLKVRHYEPPAAVAAVVMLGGVGGDFDSPARDLYSRLGLRLRQEKIASLRVQFRDPVDLDKSIIDTLAGIEFLRTRNVIRIAIVGHSFGGAVAIQTALLVSEVVAVATLSTQGFGTEGVEDLAPRPILLVHGYDDEVLPPSCSIDTFSRAGQPKTLKLFEGTRHALNEAADEVFTTVYDWLLERFQPGAGTELML